MKISEILSRDNDLDLSREEEETILQDKAEKKRARPRELFAVDAPGNDATYPAL